MKALVILGEGTGGLDEKTVYFLQNQRLEEKSIYRQKGNADGKWFNTAGLTSTVGENSPQEFYKPIYPKGVTLSRPSIETPEYNGFIPIELSDEIYDENNIRWFLRYLWEPKFFKRYKFIEGEEIEDSPENTIYFMYDLTLKKFVSPRLVSVSDQDIVTDAYDVVNNPSWESLAHSTIWIGIPGSKNYDGGRMSDTYESSCDLHEEDLVKFINTKILVTQKPL